MSKFLIILCVVFVALAEKDVTPKKNNRFSKAVLEKRSTEESKVQLMITDLTLKWMSSWKISEDQMSKFKRKLTNCTTRIRTNVQQKVRSISRQSRPNVRDQNLECIESIHQVANLSKSVVEKIDSYTIPELKKLVTKMRAKIFWQEVNYMQKLWNASASCEMNPKTRVEFNAASTCYKNTTARVKFQYDKFIDVLNFKIAKPAMTNPQQKGLRDCTFVNEVPVFDKEISAPLKIIVEYFAMCRH